ncbi:hypothetical protein pdam_00010043 [Pocillopora damicornis]|uniref:Uncharacterized protein n=1 Tax=Pocillopora damicornis TaxID=46731 RepID=A0A3M6T5C1_POCDA|nr:hypothetical protein pdam_00010043 [Pocillopora damicornis]
MNDRLLSLGLGNDVQCKMYEAYPSDLTDKRQYKTRCYGGKQSGCIQLESDQRHSRLHKSNSLLKR